MRRILAVLAVILIAALPVFADINQKADLKGANIIDIKVGQTAWNFGSGNIDQNIKADVGGIVQLIDQDSVVFITDPDSAGNINNTLHGVNLIRFDLDQYSKNYASGNVSQYIELEVEGIVQRLDQDARVFIMPDYFSEE